MIRFIYSCLVTCILAAPFSTAIGESNVTYNAGCLSPDGTKLVFKVGQELRVLEIATKGVKTITIPDGIEAAPFTGNARLWDPKSRTLVFACFNKQGTASTICLFELSQPISRILHPSFRESGSRTCPSWSPNGRMIAYFLQRRDDPHENVAWFDLQDGREEVAIHSKKSRTFIWPLIWSSDGSAIYAAETETGVLLAIDLKKKRPSELLNVKFVADSLLSPVPLDAKMLVMTGKTSRDEILFFMHYGVTSLLGWHVGDAKLLPVAPCTNGQVSPDSQRVLYTGYQAGRQCIFLYERNSGVSYVVEIDCDRPVWTDDHHIIFRRQHTEIWQRDLKTGSKQRLYPAEPVD